jgi:hypothetical protein
VLFRIRQEPESHFHSPTTPLQSAPKKRSVLGAAAAIVAIHLLLIGWAVIRSQYPLEPVEVPAPEIFSNGMPLP